MTIGNAVTSSTSSTVGYYNDSLYLNSETGILWKCANASWVQLGNFRGAKGEDGRNGTDGKDGKDGKDGTSLTASSSKEGKITTVEIKNADTGAVVDTFTVVDGSDGTGSGDMSKAEYASVTYGVVNKALNSEYADEASLAAVAAIADSVEWANTNHPSTLEGYGLTNDVNNLIENATSGKITDPSNKSANQVLTYNGSEWEAKNPSGGAEIDDTTISSDKLWSSYKTYSEIDKWHSVNGEKQVITADQVGEQTITFSGTQSDYAYKLFANTSDGSTVEVKSSSFTKTGGGGIVGGHNYDIGNLAFVVDVKLANTQFALRKITL